MNITLEFQTEGKPAINRKVIAVYRNQLGRLRSVMAKWVPAMTVEESGETELECDYNEEEDTYYLPEGWYEQINNWGEYSEVLMEPREILGWAYITPIHTEFGGDHEVRNL